MPDPGGGDSKDDFDALPAWARKCLTTATGHDRPRRMSDREVDSLREALREAFPDPSAPVSRRWCGLGGAQGRGPRPAGTAPHLQSARRPAGGLSPAAQGARALVLAVAPEAGTRRCRARPRAPPRRPARAAAGALPVPTTPGARLAVDRAADAAGTQPGRPSPPPRSCARPRSPSARSMSGAEVGPADWHARRRGPRPVLDQDVPELLERVVFGCGEHRSPRSTSTPTRSSPRRRRRAGHCGRSGVCGPTCSASRWRGRPPDRGLRRAWKRSPTGSPSQAGPWRGGAEHADQAESWSARSRPRSSDGVLLSCCPGGVS